jgi:signal transduction histidine kinase/pSer/pThr/pTyr-binding forkhead associated (FHA) protein
VPRLIVVKGADEGKTFDLNLPVLGIGRDGGNIIRLHDTEVSRRHAEVHLHNGECRLRDVGSANGTFVNNQPAKDAILRPGDHIQVGQSILVYSAGRPEPKEADLADRINMISRSELELPSAIVKTVGEAEGSRLLARPDQAETAWLRTALANLGVMYETIQAVSHILDLDQLLARIMELIFQSIEADRGCIMLGDGTSGRLEPKAVRWRDESTAADEKIPVSRTIMDYVLQEKKGVLVSDASQDERFNTGMSIVRFGICEVICVPMKGRHDTLGVLYLDTHSNVRDLLANKSTTGKFTADHLNLAIAIAHQAALAVEETRYHQAMVQAERLAAIGQTIAALSHHIKNILQGLRSGSEILKMGLADKNDQLTQQGWKIVDKNQGKIFDLVMDMLSYSKDREPAIEEVDLNQLVGEVVELLAGRAKDIGASLEMRLEESLPPIQADPEGLHRALLNVIGNAIDAVEDRRRPQVGVVTAFDAEEGWVRVAVLDNGVGIPTTKVGDIFRPFVSTKGAKGTGLGLPVSRKILREHGGDIVVQSQPGRGSRFILRLPIQSPIFQASSGTSQQIPVLKLPETMEPDLGMQNEE